MEYMKLLSGILILTSLLHDWGKANDAFQESLRKKKARDCYRHEWLSCKLVENLCAAADNDADWLQQLAEGKIDEKALIAAIQKNYAQEIGEMPPIASMICWLILCHHRMPTLKKEDCAGFVKAEGNSFQEVLSIIEPEWGYKKVDEVKMPMFSKGLLLDSAVWLQELKEASQAVLDEQDKLLEIWEAGNTRIFLLQARICLMLADYAVSSEEADKAWKGGWQVLYANTCQRKLKQKLAEHLVRVSRQAVQIANALPKLMVGMKRARNIEKLQQESKLSAFAWQDLAVKAVRENKAKSEAGGGWFVVNMAGTGCGKTFANAKLAMAISQDGESLRYSLLLGLRSLTLQTGDEYRSRVRLNENDMAVLIGSATVKELYERVKGGKEDCEKVWDDNSDTANMNELMPGDIDGGTAQDEDVLAALFPKNNEDASQKHRRLLYAPVLVSTIDHLMPGTESIRGGRFILPVLRMMTADIVIDEIDDFTGSDLVAIARLTHLAGMLGRNVILSSATIPPDLAEGLFSAYKSGRELYARFCGTSNDINCVWCDEFMTKVKLMDNQKDDDFRRAHAAYVDNHCKKLLSQPPKRWAWIKDCTDIFSKTDDERRKAYCECMKEAAVTLHQNYFVIDKKTNKKVSIGLVRTANIRLCVEVARYFVETAAWPENMAPRIMVYHSRQTLLLRTLQEKYLDGALKRKGQDMEMIDFTDSVMRKHIDEAEGNNILFIVVATPIEEVGRDHDFDWAILEPSSYRSLIQLAGRIRRHRCAFKAKAVGNICIMQYNMLALEGKKIAYTSPGFECEEYVLETHDLQQLVDVDGLAERVDAIPRVSRQEMLLPKRRLIDLEHQVLSDFRNLSNVGAAFIHGWQDEYWYLTGLPQTLNPFREGDRDIELYLEKDDAGRYRFKKMDEESGKFMLVEETYDIVHAEVEDSEKFWLERDYGTAIEVGKEWSYRVGLLTISDKERRRIYSDQYGMVEIIR